MSNETQNHLTLTTEDQLLIELLVDGELDESRRHDLLVRMDCINGGWRFCAISFLESQCLHEACHYKDLVLNTPVVSEVKMRNDSDSNQNKGRISACIQEGGTSADLRLSSPGVIMGSVALADAVPVEDSKDTSNTSSANDPLIIPMKRGGYRGFRSLGGGNGSGGGSSWSSLLLAMAGGFLVAILLSGAIALLLLPGNQSLSSGSAPVIATDIPKAGTAETTDTNTGLNSATAINTTVSRPKIGSTPIQVVTLKSPANDLNGIAVPCVESNAYTPGTLRNHQSNTYVDDLRKHGHQVETVYEDLAFPLEDGRVLILPVDTINVEYNNQIRYQ